MNKFYHTGDLGDIIACLPTMRELGGGHLFIGESGGKGRCRESMRGKRYEAIRPLLEAQDYVLSVQWTDKAPPEDAVNFSTFRLSDVRPHEDLATWQARYIGCLISLAPWLTVEPSKETHERLVLARSVRYHNHDFDWNRWITSMSVFVGTRDEHAAFESEFNKRLDHWETATLLDLAKVIAGCERFIGNQSCPFWIAAGLGVPIVQETYNAAPNSIIKRPNIQYPVYEYPDLSTGRG